MIKILSVLRNGRIAMTSDKGDIEIWGAFSGQRIGRLVAHPPSGEDDPIVHAIVTLPDGRLASADRNGPVRLWDIKRRKECGRLSGHTDGVCSLAVLPDGRLASGSYDETIRIWDVATLQEVGCLEGGHISGIDKLVPLPGNRLASGDAEWNDLMLWDLTTNSMIGDIETVAGVSMTIATAAPDGRIALGLHDGAIRLINPDTCVLSESLRGHTRAVSAICPLFDGRIASAGYDHTVRIWDIVDLAEVACHQLDFVADDLAAHPDGRLIAGNTESRLRLLPLEP